MQVWIIFVLFLYGSWFILLLVVVIIWCECGNARFEFYSFLPVNAMPALTLGICLVEEGADMFHFRSQDNTWRLKFLGGSISQLPIFFNRTIYLLHSIHLNVVTMKILLLARTSEADSQVRLYSHR